MNSQYWTNSALWNENLTKERESWCPQAVHRTTSTALWGADAVPDKERFQTITKQTFRDARREVESFAKADALLTGKDFNFLINKQRHWCKGGDNELNNRSFDTLLCMSPNRFLPRQSEAVGTSSSTRTRSAHSEAVPQLPDATATATRQLGAQGALVGATAGRQTLSASPVRRKLPRRRRPLHDLRSSAVSMPNLRLGEDFE
mmetsp:Transcript_122099/g.279670  ORF Transcript_122099/g.279670 Transcript_122099/m.279670 type:complete len:203 (-) Transcript_122099:60-668(-)|eukprot:CAMPEP_0204343962 /NCGR_PEP_ID=MMETSP0469-20131031/25271_1 /ASSEMBLY_ACC=CAM_ASM_000384 /TAXON_ID=2969 /ORGANISM="Oxyrrhis marina" /LENGTH=202 /DNA_ID=CAMNT_0051329145 /DNA_START=42 /DNA_END=650 /DNA_ORIENTATION=-